MKFISLTFLILIITTTARSEILKYTDNQGKTYFVDSNEKVPEVYKKQTQEKAKLPAISRLQAREYEKITSSTDSNKMEIYVTSWCPHCKKLEDYLVSRHVQYTKYDVEKDSVGKSKYQQIGLRGVPIVKMGSTVISGFDRTEIDQLIGR